MSLVIRDSQSRRNSKATVWNFAAIHPRSALRAFDRGLKGAQPACRLPARVALALTLVLSAPTLTNAKGMTSRPAHVGDGDVPKSIEADRARRETLLADLNASKRGRTTGCGIAETGTGTFTRHTIRVLGRQRVYYVRLPAKYDPKRAYPLIFRWHGSGGNGSSGGLGIEFSAEDDAIVVGADGIHGDWIGDSADLAFFDRMLASIESEYCIDRHRVFSYGFSVGGAFTNLLACVRGDVLRGSAAIASSPRGRGCKGRVAAWFLHDADDRVIPIAEGRAARDRAIAANGCSMSGVEDADHCVHYQGCPSAPVVWCESTGFGHNVRGDFAPQRVWRFFRSLR
jgi:poly(3-hydroxybutyrate) depolymerase